MWMFVFYASVFGDESKDSRGHLWTSAHIHKGKSIKSMTPFEVSWVDFKCCTKHLFKYLFLQFLLCFHVYIPEDMLMCSCFYSFSIFLHCTLYTKILRKERGKEPNKSKDARTGVAHISSVFLSGSFEVFVAQLHIPSEKPFGIWQCCNPPGETASHPQFLTWKGMMNDGKQQQSERTRNMVVHWRKWRKTATVWKGSIQESSEDVSDKWTKEKRAPLRGIWPLRCLNWVNRKGWVTSIEAMFLIWIAKHNSGIYKLASSLLHPPRV